METLIRKYTIFIIAIFGFTCSEIYAQKQGVVTVESSPEIKQLIQQKKDYNKSITEVKGFKIQLFYGSEQGAYRIRDEFSSLFPDTEVKIEFSRPDWKVKAGNYKTRLEADRALKEIKEEFSNAIVLADKVKI
ncbi:MAG: SPOR domain-containing protein [Flavobacteriaceae bacterium]